MRKLTATVLAGAVTLAAFTSLQAQNGPPQLPGQMDTKRVLAGTYKTDKNHSLIGFRYNHFGFNDYFGIFGDVDATLMIDPANLAGAKVEATVPINPTVASQGFHDHLLRGGQDGKKPDFFGPNPAPAHFVSTNVKVDGTKAKITGDLTLNGVTKPVTIDAVFTGAGNSMMGNKLTVGFEGSATIKRSDFGLATFVPMVGDEVDLTITTAFEKQ
ncbi:YceI family protein [Croceibacterium aestuarii]|uniref:YceI family protein n=1 Tax=Croceibacterium aestuarii TaxID=3064139 RepID=UPI00272E0AE6|nr:YceI family protein [Croceibacterium sp. D39]